MKGGVIKNYIEKRDINQDCPTRRCGSNED